MKQFGLLKKSASFSRHYAPVKHSPEEALAAIKLFADAYKDKSSELRISGLVTSPTAGKTVSDATWTAAKNIIGNYLHFGVCVSTNKVPSTRKAEIEDEVIRAVIAKYGEKIPKSAINEVKDDITSDIAQELQSLKHVKHAIKHVLWDVQNGHLLTNLSCGQLEDFFNRLSLYLDGATCQVINCATIAQQAGVMLGTPPDTIDWTDGLNWIGNEFGLWLIHKYPDIIAPPVRMQCRECDDVFRLSVEKSDFAEAIKMGAYPRTLRIMRDAADFRLNLETFAIAGLKIAMETDDKDTAEDIAKAKADAIFETAAIVDRSYAAFLKAREK